MRKHILFLIPLFVAVVLLTGCGNSPVAQNPLQNQKGLENVIKQVADDVNKLDNGQIPPATNTINTNDCFTGCAVLSSGTGLLSKETCEAGCWTEEAKQKKDITICDTKISKEDSLMQLGCRMSVAEAAGDVKFCDTIGDSKEDLMRGSCYMTIAKQKNDVTLCEGLNGTLLYQGCITDITGKE
jgi:hypothetical protein